MNIILKAEIVTSPKRRLKLFDLKKGDVFQWGWLKSNHVDWQEEIYLFLSHDENNKAQAINLNVYQKASFSEEDTDVIYRKFDTADLVLNNLKEFAG